jgi:hypothetical protein
MVSAPLKDFRGKITPETDAVLEALNRTSGRDKSEIVREILHDWAVKKIDTASVMHRLLQAEGLPGIAEGIAGNRRESKGFAGSGHD